ncbi:MAG: hypothetical protein KY469_15125 [Actinobacteria bacterium]|nr:hypothetical protein [Actinomycetota bacterium]
MAVIGVTVALAGQPLAANAHPRPGVTARVSVASDGAEGDKPAANNLPAISADGRFVAFASFASNLVPGGTDPEYEDVFVHDRATGTTEHISVSNDGTPGNDASWWPSISADGRFVAFASAATNLVPGDTNERWDVFVHDRATGVTEIVSVASDGSQAENPSYWSAISPDGGSVVFVSTAPNLVADDTNGRQDIFVHDRATGVTERVSVSSDGTESNGHSRGPVVSADGASVAFYSSASNLVPDDDNAGDEDVFVHDRETGTTERVSVTSDGREVDGLGNNTWTPAITPDGRFVAFTHSASTLTQGDNNLYWDVFVHDRQAGTTERVSVASDGRSGNNNANSPSISADGRFVAFDSFASNLVPGDTNRASDVFVHDRATGATERVSVDSGGNESDRSSWPTAISANGRFVAFNSLASNLVPGDGNGGRDVFVRDRGAPLGVGGLVAEQTGGSVRVSGWATSSGTVTSEATDADDDGAFGPLDADTLGAELTGATLTYRPEQEDHLVRWSLESLPRGPLVAGAVGGGYPGVVYGLEFEADGTRFEIRALRESATSDPPRVPHAALYRCAPSCVQEALLDGGFGTVTTEVWVALPLDVLGAEVESELSSLRAFTAIGEAAVGGLVELDEMDLPAAGIPDLRVELGIAPDTTVEDEVAFAHAVAPSEGAFTADVPVDGLSPGTYRVWARTCLGAACGPASSVEVAL